MTFRCTCGLEFKNHDFYMKHLLPGTAFHWTPGVVKSVIKQARKYYI